MRVSTPINRIRNRNDSLPATLTALIATALVTSACLSQRRVPEFLIHNPQPKITYAATDAAALTRELEHADIISHSYTPAEQIATYADREIRADNERDAAVLLALASYRYRQQARRIVVVGTSLRWRVNASAMPQYNEWIENEYNLFSEQNFDNEQALLRSHLFGFAAASERYDDYLFTLAQGGREDENLGETLQEARLVASNRKETLLDGSEFAAAKQRYRIALLRRFDTLHTRADALLDELQGGPEVAVCRQLADTDELAAIAAARYLESSTLSSPAKMPTRPASTRIRKPQ